jgi:aminoglycoside phosphotransferase (APT) family kinase protein
MKQELDLLRQALRRRFGAAVGIDPGTIPTGGGSNPTGLFDLVDGAARRRLVSRQVTLAAADSPFLPAAHQYRAMQVALKHGLAVPAPLFELEAADGMGEGFVTEFTAGESLPKRILQDPSLAAARQNLVGQLAGFLARLHNIDPAEVAFLEPYVESRDPVEAFRRYFDLYREPHPGLEVAFRWLERHRPPPRRRAFLHADLRTGNFLVGPDGLTAVLDWECCHIGAPAEDIAWLSTRSWRFGNIDRPIGGFGKREDFMAAYKAAGGEQIDAEEIRYWEIFGLLRWAVYNVMQAYAHVFSGRRSVVFAACGRNTSMIEYDLLMSIAGHYR